MELGSRAVEKAQEHERATRQRGIDAAREKLAKRGTETCEDCGEAIRPVRRAALPSATRCIGCQTKFEGK